MGNMFGSLYTGVSGLQVAQTSINTTSHNIANTDTKGYTRQQAVITDLNYVTISNKNKGTQQYGQGTDISKILQVRDAYLDNEYRKQTGRQSFYETLFDTESEVEDLTGELYGEQFSNCISDLSSAIQDLSMQPDNIVYRDELISRASVFVERAQLLQGQLNQYQVSLNTQITNDVKAINNIASQIDDMNKQIIYYNSTGESPNDYLDKRNLLLDQLSEYVGISTATDRNGSVSVYVNGMPLVSENGNVEMGTCPVSETSDMLKPIWLTDSASDSDPDKTVDVYEDLSYDGNTDVGSLKAILVSRGQKSAQYYDVPTYPEKADYTDASGTFDTAAYDQACGNYQTSLDTYNSTIGASMITTVQSQLDQLVHAIVTATNDALCPNKEVTLDDKTTITILDTDNAPIGDDSKNTVGTELFSRKSTERYTKQTVVIGGVSQDVMVYNGEDTSDNYTLYTIGEIEVNPDLLKDSSLLPLNSNEKSGNANGYDFKTTDKLKAAWDVNFASVDPNSLTKYNFTSFYNGMITDLGSKGAIWKSKYENQSTLVNNINDNRQQVMGVSSDEELVNMIKFQHAYNASSRYITVVDEMIETLLNNL